MNSIQRGLRPADILLALAFGAALQVAAHAQPPAGVQSHTASVNGIELHYLQAG
jgi:hypothetical protein